jgi:hypothetical protein
VIELTVCFFVGERLVFSTSNGNDVISDLVDCEVTRSTVLGTLDCTGCEGTPFLFTRITVLAAL